MKYFYASQQPSFCFIAPTNYLHFIRYIDDTWNIRPVHLVLAHIVERDPTYAQFYAQLSKEGHQIIMDNGAFELGGSYAPDRLIDLGRQCGADAIVLPDYPGRPAIETIAAAKEWTAVIKGAGFSTMFVPQSEVGELEDWIKGYEWASYNPSVDIIGMSILGIPNALPHIPPAYARVVMAEILKARGVYQPGEKYHHFLGLNSGPKLELPALIKMGILNSCDSSGPIWSAVLGHEYSRNTDSFLSVSKPVAHVDFDYPLTSNVDTLTRIARNMSMTVELFTDGR